MQSWWAWMWIGIAGCATGAPSGADQGAGAGAEPAGGDAAQSHDPELDPAEFERACDGLDDDEDAAIDEGCACPPGDERPCFAGEPDQPGVGACRSGMQRCVGEVEFPAWGACAGFVGPSPEACDNSVDDDCDGEVDEGCRTIDIDVSIDGDCVWAACPDSHPFPVACDVQFVGGDDRGCVAYESGSSEVYFQEGDVCDAGRLSGTITCSTEPGQGLDEANCAIDKDEPYYVETPDSCPGQDWPFGG